MSLTFNFTGKKVLVTGAGKGIGRAIAIALSKSGCKVYALSITQSTLDSLVQEHPEITPITQDLKNWDETREALERLETLDGLVNNAGVSVALVPSLESSKTDLDHCLQINLLSVINCTQVIGRKMVAAGKGGSIVNISSVVSPATLPKSLPYAAAKAGLDMATKQFALEMGPHNIRVNSVNPTLVMTDIANMDTMKHYTEIFLERMSIKRLPTMDEVASLVLYLLSDASAMVTGSMHFIDGGLTCNITTKQ